MSCLIMDYEPLCKLSTWIASLAENGYIYYGFDMPEALRISLRAFGGDLKPESIYVTKTIVFFRSANKRNALEIIKRDTGWKQHSGHRKISYFRRFL